MFLTLEGGARLFIMPQYILYYKENKADKDNQMFSMHEKAKTIIAYSQDETFYVMESFDDITKAMVDLMHKGE